MHGGHGAMRWTLDRINWGAFDPAKVDPELLKAVKAAALVEYNAPDYVSYLKNVFRDDEAVQGNIEQWGREEAQHGLALARWAKLADPSFDFEDSFQRFRKIQGINTEANSSVRGSRAGEMIARCVVESGTSSFYTAIKDYTDEPCLKQIVTFMAADEFAHYRCFYEIYKKYADELPSIVGRLKVAVGRVNEADDDELAGAFYCANYPANSDVPYHRKTFADAYQKRAMGVYQRQHFDRLISMVAKAGGLAPHGFLTSRIQDLAWWYINRQQQKLAKTAV